MPAPSPFRSRSRQILLLAAGLFLYGPADTRAAGLFGSSETRFSSIDQFPKWISMLVRERRYPAPIRQDGALAQGGPLVEAPGAAVFATSGQCRPGSPICATVDFPRLIADARPLARADQLRLVNRTLNQIRYISDLENWGVPDYWAAVREFLARNGDCEDYAIAKYMALKALGVPIDAMRIAVVQDLNLGVPHAILVVALDGDSWVLDNQIREVLPTSAIVHYQPVYSINEHGWWLHKPQ